VMFCGRISFVRLQKMVRQALDCGWSKNYRTQLQIPNFEPAPKGLFLITGHGRKGYLLIVLVLSV